MKLSLLLEANPQKDYEFRKEAQIIYNKISKELVKNFLHFEKRGDITDTEHVFLADFEERFPQYDDLEICVGKKGVGAYFSKAGHKYLIYLDVWNKHSNKLREEHYIKQSFIHEFIHYLDQKRSKESDIRGTEQYLKSGEPDKYYNDASEFNAYFQTGAKKIEDFFDKEKRYDKLWHIITNYHRFENFVSKEYAEYFGISDFIKHANPKYRKKFLQRLYQLWEFLKTKYTRRINNDENK